MAEMQEFGQGVGPGQGTGAASPTDAAEAKPKGKFSLAGALKSAESKAQGAVDQVQERGEQVVNAAMGYIQNQTAQETGPWPAPGGEWPVEWNTSKSFWYPRAKNAQFSQPNFPGRTNKTTKDSKGTDKWATTENCSTYGVWTRDCPYAFFYTLAGYIYPFSAAAYCIQRKKLLLHNPDNYECCAGLLGSRLTVLCNSCTSGNELCCMCMESFLFPWCALHANRWIVQSHYGLEDSCTDHLMIDCSIICRAPGECCCGVPECEEIATILYTPVMGCFYAQHEHEMKTRGYPYLGRTAGDLAMSYHGGVKGCGYNGNVLVKKSLPHPHETPQAMS